MLAENESYYAVIFTSKLSDNQENYLKTDEIIFELAKQQAGFIKVFSANNNDGENVTISYWRTLEDIKNWREHEAHKSAQILGKKQWYEYYQVEICKVEKKYSFTKNNENICNADGEIGA